MVELNLSENIKSKSWWIEVLFYATLAALIITVFVYGVLAYKTYFYHQKIKEVVIAIAVYSTPEEKALEKKVFDYKKTIDDFAGLIANHKTSLNVFSFMENNTLPNVWFSNFSMSTVSNEVRLSGEAEDMEILSQQFKIFEDNKDYIKNISVLNSQTSSSGKINFVLNISLDPKIFAYDVNTFLPVSPTINQPLTTQ